jgi:hypothetical protein
MAAPSPAPTLATVGRFRSRLETEPERALALLEVLVGLRSTRALGAYVLIPVRFDGAMVEAVAREGLPEGWRRSPPGPETRRAGDRWVADARSAVLRVPSAIVPGEWNFLPNPAHPDFGRIEIGEPEPLEIDPRLAGRGGAARARGRAARRTRPCARRLRAPASDRVRRRGRSRPRSFVPPDPGRGLPGP